MSGDPRRKVYVPGTQPFRNLEKVEGVEEDEGITPSLPVATLKLLSGCCADADVEKRVASEMQGITVYSHTLSLKRDMRPSREMQGFAFLHLLGPLLRMWF